MDAEKMFDKIQYPFMIKLLTKWRMRKINIPPNEGCIWEKPTANTILKCETTLFS